MMGPIGRRRHARPGISGLLAGLFVFVMLFTVGTGYFVFVNQMNTAYVHNLAANDTAMQGQLDESLRVIAASGAGGDLAVIFQNTGSVPANVTDVMVTDPSGAVHGFGQGFSAQTAPALPWPVNVAATSPSFATGLPIVPGTYTIKLVTQRGNVFVSSYPQPMTAELTTLLSSFVVTVGGSVFDTATLSGVTPTAGGNVSYSYYSDGLCTGVATPVATVTVVNGSVPPSPPVTFGTVGSYGWEAVYTGDADNSAAKGVCEPLVVSAIPDCVPSNVNICLATASQGLGSIAINWDSFRYYSFQACSTGTGGSIDAGSLVAPTTACALSPTKVTSAPTAYTISSSSWESTGAVYHAFSLNVTDADPLQRTMVLDGWTQLWFSAFNLGAGGGRANSEAYGMVNVKNAAGIPTVPITTQTSVPSVTISYGQTVTLFFTINSGGDPDNYGGGNVTPIFMLFHGTLGGSSWAENFPLTATFWLA